MPVLVYIHGGGYTFGNPRNWPFEHWVHQVPHVVIVSVYYRLDSLGFLSHSAFLEEPTLGDHNVGFLDQTEALRWVQRHVEAFGGDPRRVTMYVPFPAFCALCLKQVIFSSWGESAGAISVALHMLTNDGNTEDLFHGAFMQSGAPIPVGDISHGQAEYDALVNKTSCGGEQDTLACLRDVAFDVLMNAVDSSPSIVSYKVRRRQLQRSLCL